MPASSSAGKDSRSGICRRRLSGFVRKALMEADWAKA